MKEFLHIVIISTNYIRKNKPTKIRERERNSLFEKKVNI
jgi:hypothetical protein